MVSGSSASAAVMSVVMVAGGIVVDARPVTVQWVSSDRVLVEWPLDREAVRRRRTWLPRDDVAARVRVR